MTSFREAFKEATTFNSIIYNWEIKEDCDLYSMFYNCQTFAQEIRTWDISNAGYWKVYWMFYNAVAFVNKYSSSINSWTIVTAILPYYDGDQENITVWDYDSQQYMEKTYDYPENPEYAPPPSFTTDDYDANNTVIKDTIGLFKTNKDIVIANYGHPNTWDVSKITNMSQLFNTLGEGASDLDVSRWNVSNVTDMNGMFRTCKNINMDLSSWDVSNVTDMRQMFNLATFTSDPKINEWNVSKVTDMSEMFYESNNFNYDIYKWNISNVTTLTSMFRSETSSAFNQPINTSVQTDSSGNNYLAWNTLNVTSLTNMFQTATSFNQPIDKWNTSEVTNMQGTFSNTSFNQRLSQNDIDFTDDGLGVSYTAWNTEKVTNMKKIFYNASFNNGSIIREDNDDPELDENGKEQPSSDPTDFYWNTSSVTSFREAFKGATKFNSIIYNWEITEDCDLYSMFSNCQTFAQEIRTWDISNAGYWKVYLMFYNAVAFVNKYPTLDFTPDNSVPFTSFGGGEENITIWDYDYQQYIHDKPYNYPPNPEFDDNINLYVDGGNSTSPFYNITNENGDQVDTLDLRYTYTFYRLNDATSHPFYISDRGYKQENSDKITLFNDGSATTGITGTESFILTFTGLETTDNLTYYCTTHSNMKFNFNLE